MSEEWALKKAVQKVLPRWATVQKIAKIVIPAMAGFFALFLVAIYTIPLPERLDAPMSTTIHYDDGRPAHVFLAADGRWRMEADHTKVDSDYIEALLALEDKRFWDHPGVDLIAIFRATITNANRGRVVSGASTITMQVVRMSEPRPRTIKSKLIEGFRAVQLERHYSKEEILDIYLNLLPYGQNYEGVETASQVYFGHDASYLTPAQIATLLAVPQAPNSRYPTAANEERLRAARDGIARRLLESGDLPRGVRSDRLTLEQAMESIENTEVPTELQRMPREIPHLAYQLRSQYRHASSLETAVDRGTQRVVEEMVEQHRDNIVQLGGENVGVVVMDHQTGELKAAVGSFDYFSPVSGGQLPAYDVSRSTGSLLKPFLLAQAIDKGVAAPSHRVVDIPVIFGGYRPQNFDGNYDGLVRLDDALSRSLNIPFVNLLNQVGTDDFQRLLSRLGGPYSEDALDRHGLSLVVGGVDATPLEVATMFSALARRGDSVKVQKLNAGTDGAVPTSRRGALSAESAWLVREILQRRERPDFSGRGVLRNQPSPYAWKTGTSMGFRDAWTAGFGPRYVVVVWTGNMDQSPGRYLVGEQAAAPLFFDIIEAIDPARSNQYQPPPKGLKPVEVCSFSGHLPTAACDHTEHVELPRSSVPTEPCPYHVHLDVDKESGQAVTQACKGDRQVETKAFLRLPSPVLRFFDISGQSAQVPPAFAPGCRNRRVGSGPEIVSPPDQTTISIIPGLPTDAQQIPLEASVDGGGELNWFINGRFIGQVRGGERLWWEPTIGEHDLVVTDGYGRSQRRAVLVE